MYPNEHPALLWIKEQGPKVLAGIALLLTGYLVSQIGQSSAKNPGFSKQEALNVVGEVSVLSDESTSPESRIAAARALVPYTDKVDSAKVFDMLILEPDEEVGEEIAKLLQKYPDHPDLVRAYIRRQKPRGTVRIRLCQLFRGTTRSDLIDMVRKFTYDPNSDVRIAAYTTLGTILTPRAGRILMLRMPYEEQKGPRQALLNALAKHRRLRDANIEIWGS